MTTTRTTAERLEAALGLLRMVYDHSDNLTAGDYAAILAELDDAPAPEPTRKQPGKWEIRTDRKGGIDIFDPAKIEFICQISVGPQDTKEAQRCLDIAHIIAKAPTLDAELEKAKAYIAAVETVSARWERKWMEQRDEIAELKTWRDMAVERIRALEGHLAELALYLRETHTDELEREHYGDDLTAKGGACSYCTALTRAVELVPSITYPPIVTGRTRKERPR